MQCFNSSRGIASRPGHAGCGHGLPLRAPLSSRGNGRRCRWMIPRRPDVRPTGLPGRTWEVRTPAVAGFIGAVQARECRQSQGGWATVRVVERAEAPRQSEPAVVEACRCPCWRRQAHDVELPCGNSHSTTRSCPCAQLRQIESVSPPTLPNVRNAQNRRVLDGTFAHERGTSAHAASGAGSSPSLPRQTVPKRAQERRPKALFGTVCARL